MKAKRRVAKSRSPTRPAASPVRAPRRRVAVGPPRPQYLLNEENDRMMMIITALTAEVSVLRDRLDTHEALGEKRRFATRKAVDQYRLPPARQADREAQRQLLLARVYRILMEELDEVRQGESLQARQLLETEVAAD